MSNLDFFEDPHQAENYIERCIILADGTRVYRHVSKECWDCDPTNLEGFDGEFFSDELGNLIDPPDLTDARSCEDCACLQVSKNPICFSANGLTYKGWEISSINTVTLEYSAKVAVDIHGTVSTEAYVIVDCPCGENVVEIPQANDDSNIIIEFGQGTQPVQVSFNDIPCPAGQITDYRLSIGSEVNVTVVNAISANGIFNVIPTSVGPWSFEYDIYCDGAYSGETATVSGEAEVLLIATEDPVGERLTGDSFVVDTKVNDLLCTAPEVTTWLVVPGSIVNATVIDNPIDLDGDFTVTPLTDGDFEFYYELLCDGAPTGEFARVYGEGVTPSISLIKEGDVQGLGEEGDVINYTFTVTNDGTADLTNITISDPLVTITGGPIDLLIGQSDSTTFTASYTITAADILSGEVSNQATVTATPPNGLDPITDLSDDPTDPNSDNDPTVIVVPESQIELLKSSSIGLNPQVGDTINYTFTVNNTGVVDLTNVTVTDPLATVVGGPIPLLAAGASDSVTFTATYVLTQADIDAGSFTNQATVTGTNPDMLPVTDLSNDPNIVDGDPDTPTVTPIDQVPVLKVLKEGVVTTDGDITAIIVGGVPVPISVGQTVTLDNGATVTLMPDGTLDYFRDPFSLSQNFVSDNINWTLPGISDLTAPGYTPDWERYDARSLTYTNLQGQIIPELVITLSGTGTFDDSIALDLTGDGTIDWVATQGDAVAAIGGQGPFPLYSPWFDASYYEFEVIINTTGTTVNASWNGIPITPGVYVPTGPGDLQSPGFNNAAAISLADLGFNPDGSIPNNNFTTSEIRLGSINDSGPGGNDFTWALDDLFVIVDAVGVEFTTTTSTTTETIPVFLEEDTVYPVNLSPYGDPQAGDTIEYNFTLQNCGNVTLTDITITDPLVAVVGGPIDLNVGESDSTSFTATYTLTQSDMLNGQVENQATAIGSSPQGTGDVTVDSSNTETCTEIVSSMSVNIQDPDLGPYVSDLGIGGAITFVANAPSRFSELGTDGPPSMVLVSQTVGDRVRTNIISPNGFPDPNPYVVDLDININTPTASKLVLYGGDTTSGGFVNHYDSLTLTWSGGTAELIDPDNQIVGGSRFIETGDTLVQVLSDPSANTLTWQVVFPQDVTDVNLLAPNGLQLEVFYWGVLFNDCVIDPPSPTLITFPAELPPGEMTVSKVKISPSFQESPLPEGSIEVVRVAANDFRLRVVDYNTGLTAQDLITLNQSDANAIGYDSDFQRIYILNRNNEEASYYDVTLGTQVVIGTITGLPNGNFNMGDFNDTDKQWYLTGSNLPLYRVDPITLAVSLVAGSANTPNGSGDIAFDDQGGYWVKTDFTINHFPSIGSSTADQTITLAANGDIDGGGSLAFQDDILIGAYTNVGQIWQIPVSTGVTGLTILDEPFASFDMTAVRLTNAFSEGQAVLYETTVCNTGTNTLTNVGISDSDSPNIVIVSDPAGLATGSANIAPGICATISYEYSLDAQDIVDQSHTNTVTASADNAVDAIDAVTIQPVIQSWTEDFSDLTLGSNPVSDTGDTAWTTTGTIDYTEVVANGLRIGGDFTWQTEVIDVSSFGTVSLNYGVSENGALEPSDFMTIDYRLDGGAWVNVANQTGNFTNDSGSLIIGTGSSTLEVRVVGGNNLSGGSNTGPNEYLIVNLIEVIGN